MSSLMDSPTGTTTLGNTIDPLSSSLSTNSLLNTTTPAVRSPSASRVNSSPGLLVSPTPRPGSTPYGDPDGFISFLTDGNGFIYTTTFYSTRDPSSPTSTLASNLSVANTPGFSAIIAGVGGGVGLLLLLVGVIWFIQVRRAKRRAGKSVITDRKFYPDRYNQTVTSNRHSEYNEIDPGPVVVQLPRPPPLPLSERTSSYQNHVPFPQTHGSWAGNPLPDGVLEDIPPLARHRVPYPSTPPQPLVDQYTMLPSRSTSSSNTLTTPLQFAPNPPPRHSHHPRSSPSTHRRHHSHHSYYNRPQHRKHDATNNPYFPPTPFQNPSPSPMRMARRNTILVSPPMSPSAFSFLSSPPPDLPATRVGSTTVTLTSQSSIARSTLSSTDPPVVVNQTTRVRRMMCTNPDSDVDPDTDTEPDEPGKSGSGSGSGSGGSPSATDIIRLYDRDRDRDTSSANSVMRAGSISVSTEGD